jgi:ATP-dependent DNA helicase RecG
MTPSEVEAKLDELLKLPAETEWVEFKEAKNTFHFNELGQYFSALSNEANLKNQTFSWLVFGIEDKSRTFVNSQFRLNRKDLDSLKEEIANQTNNRMTFDEIYEVIRSGNRVVMFRIPPALRGIPTAWKGHYYGRDNESLVALSLHEIEQIRKQYVAEDWSKQFCDGATLDHLDPLAIKKAREVFKIKHPKLTSEVDGWDDLTFLNKAKICIEGRITNAAIILLGKEESTHFISPSVAQITWVLKNSSNVDKDYRHYGPPFLLAVDQLFANVRNLTIRHLPDGTLFPVEVSQYDPRVLREILHNCIAHQDYSMRGRVNAVEVEDDSILFTNLGQFLPGSIEEVIRRDQPQEEYRNRFLVDAMVNLNMIDTIGSGIRRCFGIQRERNFPMPTYDLSESGKVKVRVIGQILDPNYTRMLMSQTNLDLLDVIALDKVQKGITITDEEVKSLRNKKLIEGRRPNIHVSADVAAATDTMVDYLTKRGIDKNYCQKMVVELLSKKAEASRPEIESLLMAKLSDALDDDQKRNFIKNLLQEMKRDGIVRPIEGKRGPGAKWELSKRGPKDET